MACLSGIGVAFPICDHFYKGEKDEDNYTNVIWSFYISFMWKGQF